MLIQPAIRFTPEILNYHLTENKNHDIIGYIFYNLSYSKMRISLSYRDSSLTEVYKKLVTNFLFVSAGMGYMLSPASRHG